MRFRFFITTDKADPCPRTIGKFSYANYQVRDRDTLESGVLYGRPTKFYKVIANRLTYLDAFKLSESFNRQEQRLNRAVETGIVA